MSGREVLERLRKRHVQAGAAAGDPQPSCLWCGNLQAWPCDQARLVAALEEALARLTTQGLHGGVQAVLDKLGERSE